MQFCQSTESPNWGYFSIFHKNREVKFPINTETNEIFNSDPPNLIRFKCLALAVHTPIVSIARAVYNLAKSIFVALQHFYYYLDDQNPIKQNIPSFYKTIHEVPRALRYGVSLTKAAFLGIFSPLEKRRLYGELERKLNRHKDGVPHRDKFYFAICAQPLSKLPVYKSEEEVKKVEARLIRYITKIDDGLSALRSCDFYKLHLLLIQSTK